MSFAKQVNNIITKNPILAAKELLKFSKEINKRSNISLILGMVVNNQTIIYCTEIDPQRFLKNTILNKKAKKIILDNEIVIFLSNPSVTTFLRIS
jgi:hypothetical protein